MHNSICYYKDILEIIYYISASIGAISILVYLIIFKLNIKQLNHDILVSCNKRYQDILKQNSGFDNPTKTIIQQYLDLCSDELFYYKNDYIKDKVIINDWLDGMIPLLPHLVNDKNVNKDDLCLFKEDKELNIFNSYKRIKATFTFENENDYGEFINKKDLREKLLINLNDYKE